MIEIKNFWIEIELKNYHSLDATLDWDWACYSSSSHVGGVILNRIYIMIFAKFFTQKMKGNMWEEEIYSQSKIEVLDSANFDIMIW